MYLQEVRRSDRYLEAPSHFFQQLAILPSAYPNKTLLAPGALSLAGLARRAEYGSTVPDWLRIADRAGGVDWRWFGASLYGTRHDFDPTKARLFLLNCSGVGARMLKGGTISKVSVVPEGSVLQSHDRVATGFVAVTLDFLLVEIDAEAGGVADIDHAVFHPML